MQHMFIHNRVIVKVKGNGFTIVPGDIIPGGVFPPFLKRTMMIGIKQLIVKSQTETGTT